MNNTFNQVRNVWLRWQQLISCVSKCDWRYLDGLPITWASLNPIYLASVVALCRIKAQGLLFSLIVFRKLWWDTLHYLCETDLIYHDNLLVKWRVPTTRFTHMENNPYNKDTKLITYNNWNCVWYFQLSMTEHTADNLSLALMSNWEIMDPLG